MDRDVFFVEKGLRTFDPYSQSELLPLERQEPDIQKLDILNRYSVKAEKIYCHICGGKRHNNGFTGVVSGDGLILFGSSCAKDYFCEEVLRLAGAAFAKREDIASAEFKIKKVKATAGEMRRWLHSNKGLIASVADSWDTVLSANASSFSEIISHLEKNNNRLTEEFVEEASDISRTVGRTQRVVTKRIICVVRNFAPLRSIRDFRNHLRVISTLPEHLLELDDSATAEDLIELDKKLRTNFLSSLRQFEAVLRFSAEVFTEPTFGQICKWSDRQRILRLQQTDISPRNLAVTLRKKIGDGYELPKLMLQQILASDGFLLGEDAPSSIDPAIDGSAI